MALCFQQEIGLVDDLLADEQDISCSCSCSSSYQTLTRYTCSRNPVARCLLITTSLHRSISHKHRSPSFWCWVM
ncbi:hypothetical protein AB3S75_043080 [Citrus x aurantiifolia]